MTSCSSSSVGVNVMSSSNNDVISGESDMAAGTQGGNERSATTGPSGGGRRFRLLPSLHNVLFPGCGRRRGPSSAAGFKNGQREQLSGGSNNQGDSAIYILHEKM